jgi:ABC-type transporter Mla subunit MlaD
MSHLADAAQQAGSQARDAASSLATEATQSAKDFLDQKVAGGADVMSEIAQSVRGAADNLGKTSPQIAGLFKSAADQVDDFSQTLRGQSVEDMVKGVSDFTRRQPALVFGAAALAGFFLFRALKAGSSAASSSSHDGRHAQSYGRAGQSHGV